MRIEAAQFLIDRDAGGLGLDQHLVHFPLLGGLGNFLDQLVDRQLLLPSVDQQHLRRQLAIGALDLHHAPVVALYLAGLSCRVMTEHAPHRHSTEVVFFFLGVGGVDRRQDVFEWRVGIVGRLPKLPPFAQNDAATARRWLLLILAGKAELAHYLAVTLDNFERKPFWEQQFVWLGARVDGAQHGRRCSDRVIQHRQHDVIVSQFLVEDHAADVIFVQALHDDDNGRFLGVVKARGDGFEEGLHFGLPLHFGRRRVDAMWVVDDDAVTTNTGQAGNGGGNAEALRRIDEVQFFVLITRQLHAVTPMVLIPFAGDQLTHAPAVARR